MIELSEVSRRHSIYIRSLAYWPSLTREQDDIEKG